MLLGRTALFGLALASAALLGVVGEAASPLVKFPAMTSTVGICPNWFIYSNKLFQHLGYLLALDYQPCPIWTFT